MTDVAREIRAAVRWRTCTIRYLAAALVFAAMAAPANPQAVVYRAGEGGYSTYRIPALVTTAKGTLLAFCEGRRNSASDAGDIDVLLRRSFDNGKSWSPVEVVADMSDDTVGNPTPVVERATGDILLLLTRNPGRINEAQIIEGNGQRTVWLTRSRDDGATWTPPVEITGQVKQPDWTWYATGPGNGIQLRSGRIVIPCDHNLREGNQRHSHVIYSDDRGETWHIGGVAAEKTNESAVVELRNGDLLLNMRSYHGRNRRAIQRSHDGGLTFTPLEFEETLIEPVCQASLIATGRGRLVFSNPAATTRTRMTLRVSKDEGASWNTARVVYEGPSAYSSLARLRNGWIGLLYERGTKSPYETIVFTRFRD